MKSIETVKNRVSKASLRLGRETQAQHGKRIVSVALAPKPPAPSELRCKAAQSPQLPDCSELFAILPIFPRNLDYAANFPQMRSRMIAPMIDRMKPAG